MALPTKEELSVIETFRGKVADILTDDEVADDMFLIRWLRARDLNLDQAEDMLRNAIKWRKDNNLDSLIIGKTSSSYYRENFPVWMDGVDKEGRPVMSSPFGRWDVRKVVREGKSQVLGALGPIIWPPNHLVAITWAPSFSIPKYGCFIIWSPVYCVPSRPSNNTLKGPSDGDKMIRGPIFRHSKSQEFIGYLTECFEGVSEAIRTSAARHPPQPGQPPITQLVGIYDWEGFAWGQLFNYKAISNFLQIGSIYEAYYPEILYKFYFVNCPALISSVLTLLKPVLAPKTMNKIVCMGSDKKVWQEELLKVIDADQLRQRFGGTMAE